MREKTLILVVMSLLSAGCSAPKLMSNESPELGPGEAFIALPIETRHGLKRVIFLRQPGNDKLKIKDIPLGKSMSLVRVQAGRYCLKEIETLEYIYKWEDDTAVCFTADSGGVFYPGHIERQHMGLRITKDYALYVKTLKQDYPLVFDRYVK